MSRLAAFVLATATGTWLCSTSAHLEHLMGHLQLRPVLIRLAWKRPADLDCLSPTRLSHCYPSCEFCLQHSASASAADLKRPMLDHESPCPVLEQLARWLSFPQFHAASLRSNPARNRSRFATLSVFAALAPLHWADLLHFVRPYPQRLMQAP